MRIFTDASTSGRVSGIAFVITDNQHNIILKKEKPLLEVDNNFAELAAILFALEELPETHEQIIILSDSQYALSCIQQNHSRKFEKPTLDLIKYHLTGKQWTSMWIKGHKNDGTMLSTFNREADHMASHARKTYVLMRRKEKYRKQQLLKQSKLINQGVQYE